MGAYYRKLLWLTPFLCGVSHADLSTSVSGAVEIFDPNPDFVVSCSASGSGSSACSDYETQGFIDLSATSDYGDISGSAMGANSVSALLGFSAGGSSSDMLTIDLRGRTSGFVQYTISMVGSAVSSDWGMKASIQQDGSVVGSWIPYISSANGLPVNTTYMTGLIPFTSGVPFSFFMDAFTDTYLECCGIYNSSVQDQIHVKLVDIAVYSAIGRRLDRGYTISSPSSTYGGLVTLSNGTVSANTGDSATEQCETDEVVPSN